MDSSNSSSSSSNEDVHDIRTASASTLVWDNKVAPEPLQNIPMLQTLNTGTVESNGVGNVGIKWRVKILRVYDSEEQWTGSVEIYFHWHKSKNIDSTAERKGSAPERPRRRLSVGPMTQTVQLDALNSCEGTMEIIPRPDTYPIFAILNDEKSVNTEEVYYTYSKAPAMLFGYVEYHVTVHERLELERFPFDRQFFKLEIECSNGDIVLWHHREIPTLMRDRLTSAAEKQHFFGESETPSWQLDVLSVERGTRFSTATMSLGMSRLSGFYLSNVVIPCFLIGTGSVLTTGIEATNYSDRFQCMIALFLTLVAIKFVANFLPVISYSTLLDQYTLTAYIFLALWMLENFLVSPLVFGYENKHMTDLIDMYAAAAYLTFWLLFHIIIVIGAKWDLFRKDWVAVKEDDEEQDPNAHKESNKFD